MVVSDVAVKVVMKKELKGNASIVLITDKLSAGTYVVKVTNEGEQYSQSLVIIK